MKTKLTLSLPESTIRTAKQLAKSRRTTVSALFSESVEQWSASSRSSNPETAGASAKMTALLGALREQKAFDARSAHIRSKHG